MKYPYIGQFKTTNTETLCLFYKEGFAINLDDKELTGTDLYIESAFTNITHEYLQNTYGVVESKEHAEFIVELCKVNGIKVESSANPLTEFFLILPAGHVYFCEKSILKSLASNSNFKQITIPLTPKEPLKNAGDNLILGCEDSKCDEWPQVGDEVLIDVSGRDVIYGKNIDGLIAVVRSIFKDGEATVYAVSRDGACYCFTGGIIKKPKTPEEELRDDVAQLIDGTDGLSSRALTWALMDKYNITKKPQ